VAKSPRQSARSRPGGHEQAWEQLEGCRDQIRALVRQGLTVVKIGVLLEPRCRTECGNCPLCPRIRTRGRQLHLHEDAAVTQPDAAARRYWAFNHCELVCGGGLV
jgi:hypothetical protein